MLEDEEIEIEEVIIETNNLTKERIVAKPQKKSQSRMTKTDEVENIELTIEGNILNSAVDLDIKIGTTKKGKTSIATTHGNKFYTLNNDYGCFLSLTVFEN